MNAWVIMFHDRKYGTEKGDAETAASYAHFAEYIGIFCKRIANILGQVVKLREYSLRFIIERLTAFGYIQLSAFAVNEHNAKLFFQFLE